MGITSILDDLINQIYGFSTDRLQECTKAKRSKLVITITFEVQNQFNLN